jgi:hypothetical protein
MDRVRERYLLAMTLIGTILILAYETVDTSLNADGQIPYNGSSASTTTVCVNNQPCSTTVCTNNQPCQISKSPNIESPYEDSLDDIEDIFD